jgi:uncharacterized membrane protein
MLLACADGEEDTAVDAFCADAPVTTYDNFGQGFVLQHCQSCHASTSENRYDAPDELDFDDEDAIWGNAERILARAAGDAPTMPPQGGVEEADRVRLEQWLLCE